MINGKYGNKKTEVQGILFDSKRESERYKDLRMMEQVGVISGLRLQPEYVLQEGFEVKNTKGGKNKIRAIKYRGDFEYWKNGLQYCEDTKGFKTEVYKLKKKMFLKKFPEIVFKES